MCFPAVKFFFCMLGDNCSTVISNFLRKDKTEEDRKLLTMTVNDSFEMC